NRRGLTRLEAHRAQQLRPSRRPVDTDAPAAMAEASAPATGEQPSFRVASHPFGFCRVILRCRSDARKQGRGAQRLAQLEAGTRARSFTPEQRSAAVVALTLFAGGRYGLI